MNKLNNFLDNGAVLPFGLIGINSEFHLDGFKKTFDNPYLKVGIVTKTYEVSDSNNISKLTPEYDVMVFEQDADRGSTVITYKNCLSSSSLGSIADFLDVKLRSLKKNKKKGTIPSPDGQDGSIVLLLCLNGLSDRGIIIGALKHPDRKTTLLKDGPHLEGEYNGVNIKVNSDGSTSLTFKGATDNEGKVLNKEQGNTVISIEKDGSYQVGHKTATHRMDKNGKVSLSADDDVSNTSKKNFNVTATENIVLKATKNLNIQSKDLIANASGSALLECQKLDVKSKSDISIKGSQFKLEAEALANIKATQIILDGLVFLGGAGGQPLLMLNAMILVNTSTGPAIGNAISGYTTKVLGQ